MNRKAVLFAAIMFAAVIGTLSVCFIPGTSLSDADTSGSSDLGPLCFTAIDGVSPSVGYEKHGTIDIEIESSFDGENWTSWDGQKINLKIGDKLYVRNNESTLSKDTTNYFQFKIDGKIAASGDVSSMINYSELKQYCYYNLFTDCTTLSTAPALPAINLANGCYSNMFNGCIALTTAPALPATTLADNCYDSMFRSCRGLMTAPALPATTLASSCYKNMFHTCYNLTTAPALPATTLASSCYQEMFYGCSTLTNILCLATNIDASDCTDGWVNDVKGSGTFYTHDKNIWTNRESKSGIPEGWTVPDSFTAVIFNPNGGAVSTTYMIANGEGKLTNLPNPSYDKHKFIGWYTAAEGGTQIHENETVFDKDTMVYAHWQQYTITFDAGEGTGAPDPITGYGEITLPKQEPTYVFNTFIGWKDGETIYKAGSTYDITKDATLYAVWGGTITFDPFGGTSEIVPIVGANDTVVNLPNGPTHESYEFKGWYDHITIYDAGSEYTIFGDVTMYAIWGDPAPSDICIVSFDLNGGTGSFGISKIVKGESYTLPSDIPSRTGFEFSGWEYNGDTYLPSEQVTVNSDMVFNAQWTVNQYTITFDTDGGSSIDPITQDYGTVITAPADPTKVGYEFKGWNPAIPTTMPAESITVTAMWEVVQYTMTFKVDDGVYATNKYNFGATITAPADPTKVGYEFKGWDPAVPATMPDNDVTVDAQWTVNQYTITFNTDGGSSIDPITQDYGTVITAPANPTKTGCTFKGWNPAVPATMPAEDITVTAMWNEYVYIVSFDLTGGNGMFPALKAVGGTVTLYSEVPTKTGYAFKEWGCGGETYQKGVTITGITEDMTLTAVYEANEYTVKFDANSGQGSMDPATFEYGTSYNLPANKFNKDGFNFIGWSIDGTKIVKYNDEENVINLAESGTVTLYAVWGPVLDIKTDAVIKGDSFDMDISAGAVGAVTVTEQNGSERVLVCGSDYELSNGTMIKVLGACTGELSAGDCMFRVYTADGVAEGTVKINSTDPEPQKDNTAMIGIIVGAIAAVALIGGAIYFFRMR